jgi:hypothetical protein
MLEGGGRGCQVRVEEEGYAACSCAEIHDLEGCRGRR